MLFSGGLGVLHHIDHILRFDHSGWPFRDVVTPFFYCLLVYPLLGVAFCCRRSGWSRFAILLLILLLTRSAHIFLETPIQQYWVWVYIGFGPTTLVARPVRLRDCRICSDCDLRLWARRQYYFLLRYPEP